MRQEPLPIGNYDVILVSVFKAQAKFRITSGEFKGQNIFMPILSMSPKQVTISHGEHEHDKGIIVTEIAKPISN